MSTSWQASESDPSRSPEPEPWQVQQPEPQWSQPPFAPGYQEAQQFGYPTAPPPQPALPDVVSGSVLIPGGRVPPAGGLESTLRVISGLLWPLVIAVLIFGGGSWWFGIIFAIIASAVLKQITRELRRRRVMDSRIVPPPSQPTQDLQ
ncbi:MAG: hypothetical protein AAGC63_12230 [Propionicimonas sp.]|nr:hypothetical protein [Propionicimonas sp.]